MAQQRLLVRDTQQRVHQAAVTDVDLGRANESLAYIDHARRESPHEQEIGEQVDVPADGCAGHLEIAS